MESIHKQPFTRFYPKRGYRSKNLVWKLKQPNPVFPMELLKVIIEACPSLITRRTLERTCKTLYENTVPLWNCCDDCIFCDTTVTHIITNVPLHLHENLSFYLGSVQIRLSDLQNPLVADAYRCYPVSPTICTGVRVRNKQDFMNTVFMFDDSEHAWGRCTIIDKFGLDVIHSAHISGCLVQFDLIVCTGPLVFQKAGLMENYRDLVSQAVPKLPCFDVQNT